MDKKDNKIDFKSLSEKWTKYWQDERIYQPDLGSAKNKFYNLMMFPYPSAEGLHVGNMYAFTGADVYGRFKRMQGHQVFEPIGLDGFGIHSENYALKIGSHPMDQSKISEKRFYEQLHMIGNGYDWDHTVETYKPDYYRWTQWIFTTFFKAGLVVKKKSPVNWCPKDKTVLADEQVIGGCCERCGTVVETRELEQWFFRITQYAEQLLEGLNRIDWTEKVKLAQKNWIGKSTGASVSFEIEGLKEKLEVFTTRPDTLFGATFMVISPAHPILSKFDLPAQAREYIKTANLEKARDEDESKEKTGVFSGKYAINPVNGEKIPVWIADYVLMGYGTGAIMAVPAHDQRDFDFAKKYDLPIKQVVSGPKPENEAHEGNGELINSGDWDSIKVPQNVSNVIEKLEENGLGEGKTNYHLRDWLISRQRYWGAPIPMVFCEKCFEAKKSYFDAHADGVLENVKLEDPMFGWFPVEDSNLPVELPYIKEFKPLGTGEAPLASDPEFVNTTCPNCGAPAKRETDVCDTFLDSSWYFMRYPSTDFDTVPFDPQITEKWLPVDIYIGGAEHSVLHLLYSRFVGYVLHDLGKTSFDEPFPKFRAHGLIIKEGSKMSKSKGNVVNPDDYVEKFGADAIRIYLMFLGPFQQGGDFRDSGMEGMGRFVKRIWKFVNYQLEGSSDTFLTDEKLDILMNKTVKSVSQDIESLSYNTAIARIMEYLNELTKKGVEAKLDRKYLKTLILLLAPFAPFMTEELFHKIDSEAKSVHLSQWPSFDESKTQDEFVTIAIQVNGKLRDTLSVGLDQSANEEEIKKMAFDSEKIKPYTEGKDIKKTIYVPGKILSIVV